MRAYHFIKYNDTTSPADLRAQTNDNTVLCFDLEDSIQDCLHPANTASLKATYRNYFKKIIDQCTRGMDGMTLGVRLNAMDTPEYALDLKTISGIQHITAIFLPKISQPEQIIKLRSDLARHAIRCDEIIPVIETKPGFRNLEPILQNNAVSIRHIAFGHCDYNLDNHIYPFFHQDAREYWTWVTRIAEVIKQYRATFINSPFLQLDNDAWFVNMLKILYAIGGDNTGQITLTKKQTALCQAFTANSAELLLPKLTNRLDLSVPPFYAEHLIEAFERNCLGKGFAIRRNRTLLSPQEYQSSLQHLDKASLPVFNFVFVGGCFPVQGNVPFENLFHQVLRKKIEANRECQFAIHIIRYERFANCLQKIEALIESKEIDVLAFSIRPEPFLRLVKLYYRFLDDTTGKKRWSLNLPFLNKVNPERFDLLSVDTRYNPVASEDRSAFRKLFIDLNYILGSLLGNGNYALRAYVRLLDNVITVCKKNKIELIILGPPVRSNTIVERLLSRKLDSVIRRSLPVLTGNFISGTDRRLDGEPLFDKKGIYASEKYHALIADRMLENMLGLIDKMRSTQSMLAGMRRKVVYEKEQV